MMTNQLKTVREAKAVQPALFLLIVLAVVRPGWADRWDSARKNGEDSQKAIRFCRRYANGWLMHVDPATGLFPRTINGGWFWNGRDCAADNFPFFALTAYVTDDYHLKRAAMHILEQEKRLTSRIDGLPDVYDFEKQGFRS
ncbi:MAG: hypothetical protein JXA69_15245, partial [Phycisphaerae bacterium]|nr:hypothetical protein [Phycisphaerae bacterium]